MHGTIYHSTPRRHAYVQYSPPTTPCSLFLYVASMLPTSANALLYHADAMLKRSPVCANTRRYSALSLVQIVELPI